MIIPKSRTRQFPGFGSSNKTGQTPSPRPGWEGHDLYHARRQRSKRWNDDHPSINRDESSSTRGRWARRSDGRSSYSICTKYPSAFSVSTFRAAGRSNVASAKSWAAATASKWWQGRFGTSYHQPTKIGEHRRTVGLMGTSDLQRPGIRQEIFVDGGRKLFIQLLIHNVYIYTIIWRGCSIPLRGHSRTRYTFHAINVEEIFAWISHI